jgi:hypothetical protein
MAKRFRPRSETPEETKTAEARRTIQQLPLDLVDRETRLDRIADAFFPFLMRTAKVGQGMNLTYNRERLLDLMEVFKTRVMSRAESFVGPDGQKLPEEIMSQFANAVSFVSKFYPMLCGQIDEGGGEVILAVVLAMRDSMDSVCSFLEIKSHGQPFVVDFTVTGADDVGPS